MKFKILYIFVISLIVFSGCKKKLDVENDTNPSIKNIYADPPSVYGVASSMFYNWYINAQTHSWSPAMSMMVMADQGTSSWLNSGVYDLSREPRLPFDNSESYRYAKVFDHYWSKLYANRNTSNDVLKVLNDGMQIGTLDASGQGADTKMVEAMSYFIQGLSLGYLGLNYDRAYIITEKTDDPASEPLSSYSEVTAAGIAALQKCASIAQANNFIIPSDWIKGKDYTNNELAELANSYCARFLVYNSRNASENSAVNWQQVLDYANQGITQDFEIFLDNVNWKNWVYHYTYERDDWVRVDARIIHLMDTTFAAHITSGADPGVAHSVDARLGTDFVHTSVCPFKPERGYEHFSYYLYHRLTYSFSNPGNFPEFYKNELDLIKAEAYVHLGQLPQAITIMNNSSRVTRGHLTPLSNSLTKDAILKAIFYERDIELFVAGFGTDFYDMRRRDMLQKGTMLHFPIPAKELNVMGIPIYTFGGVANADGVNTSNGGWF